MQLEHNEQGFSSLFSNFLPIGISWFLKLQGTCPIETSINKSWKTEKKIVQKQEIIIKRAKADLCANQLGYLLNAVEANYIFMEKYHLYF